MSKVTESMKALGMEKEDLEDVTLEMIKSYYKNKMKEVHPDHHDQARERVDYKETTKVNVAFEYLKEVFKSVTIKEVENTRTTSGEPLATLGKGLGSNKNIKKCNGCNGKGYYSQYQEKSLHEVEECDCCKGQKLRSYPCKYCKGTGDYRPGVECKVCKGTGSFYPRDKRKNGESWKYLRVCDIPVYVEPIKIPNTDYIGLPCKKCKGKGSVIISTVIEIGLLHFKCHNCKGAGVLELWNPVLTKDALHMLKSNNLIKPIR